MELPELCPLPLLLDLLAEILELLLLGVVLLLRLPHVLDVAEAPRVPSLLVQKLQRHPNRSRSESLDLRFSRVRVFASPLLDLEDENFDEGAQENTTKRRGRPSNHQTADLFNGPIVNEK